MIDAEHREGVNGASETAPGGAVFAEPHALDRPRARLRWLFARPDGEPAWFENGWLPPGQRMLYARARQGLFAALEGIDREGPVLVPAYIPGGVTWAAMAAGFDVRYYPVTSELSLPVEAVTERIETLDPAAMVFVHYFGFADEAFPELAARAAERAVIVVEDCARGLFSRDHAGRLLGSTGDVAMYCLHKTLPVPNGGLIVTRHADLEVPGERAPEWRVLPRIAALSLARRARIPLDPAPSVDPAEEIPLSSVEPRRPVSRPGTVTERGLAWCDPVTVRETRRQRYRQLRESLSDVSGLRIVSPALNDGASPFGVVALAESSETRAAILGALRRRGLPCDVLTWPPVHDAGDSDTLQSARVLRERLMVFPTHQQLSPAAVDRVAAVVAETVDSP